MIPSLRPVLPLFDLTAPRWGSSISLRPRHVFHVQRFLSHDRKSEKEEDRPPRTWSFPRGFMPFWTRIWWTTRRLLFLPIRFITLIVSRLCFHWRIWDRPMVKNDLGINSHAEFLLYDISRGCVGLLHEVIKPWGLLFLGSGPSMKPTIPATPAPVYASYAYLNKRDVRRGDVVVAIPPKPHDKSFLMCKRVAALEGDRIRVTKYTPKNIPHKIVHVRFSSVMSLLSSVFTYDQYRYRWDTAIWLVIILQGPLTQGHSVRCQLNPLWLNCNGDWA